MNKINRFLLLALLTACWYGCEKDNITLPDRLENSTVVTPLMFDATVAERNRVYQLGLNAEVSGYTFPNGFSVGTISQGATGPVMHLGIAAYAVDTVFDESFPFSLKFRADEMNIFQVPSQSSLEAYFVVGREFTFGNGNGMAELGILLPGHGPESRRSRSGLVEMPEGTVTVERIEPFVAPLSEIAGGEREYQMITFSFAGEIGIYNHSEELAAEQRGEPYIATETARVNGSATLVLAVRPG